MKKYLILLLAAATVLVSCGTEIIGPDNSNETAQSAPITFKLAANHPDATKAVKSGWENGDAIFVFFSGVASELATNKTYVSAILNSLSGEKFTSLITRYRIEYAQRLMREHPDMLLDDVADESGFSSRTTFFRSFKALTGMTPQEWKNKA